MDPAITLAHLSDLHLRRGFPERWEAANEALALQEVRSADLVVVTGDVTESGLTNELEMAEELFDDVARQGRLLVVPGNHDASLHGLNAGTIVNRLTGVRRMVSDAFADVSVVGGSARRIGSRGSPWPVRRLLAGGRCAVYGLDSTRASLGDLLARGCCGESQLDALDEDLDALEPGTRVVFVLHHHVTSHPGGRGAFDTDPALELLDKRQVQALLRRYRVELVLHGHRHRFWHRCFRDAQVIGGASTTLGCHRLGERFVVLATLQLDSGVVTARLRYLDRREDVVEDVLLRCPER
ncbi:MAG: metallophosphoesterase family protein [Myxococcota bacterium]